VSKQLSSSQTLLDGVIADDITTAIQIITHIDIAFHSNGKNCLLYSVMSQIPLLDVIILKAL
jgi:hypothetical protein